MSAPRFLLPLILLTLPVTARADVIIPFTAAGSYVSLLLLLPVVAVEAVILKLVLRLPWGQATGASLRANAITMGVGYLLLLLLLVSLFAFAGHSHGGIADLFEWNVVYWHLLPWGGLLSYLIEKRVVQNYLDAHVTRLWVSTAVGNPPLMAEADVGKACAWANLVSYGLIAVTAFTLNSALTMR
jgi:hypothetical protein